MAAPEGYETQEAPDAETALELVAAGGIGVVLCDVTMPGRGGLWLVERMREAHPAVAVVLATGVEYVHPSISLGGNVVHYLVKPFERATVLAAVALARDWHEAAIKKGEAGAGKEPLATWLADRQGLKAPRASSTLSASCPRVYRRMPSRRRPESLLALSFPKFGHPALGWIALAPLLVALAGATLRRAFTLGLLAGVVYFTGTLYWITGVMATYGDMARWVAVLINALLVLYQSLYRGDLRARRSSHCRQARAARR